jgi:hypothetical protein
MATSRVIRLASGRSRRIPAGIDNVVGIDGEGRIVVDTFDVLTNPAPKPDAFLFGLTLCCNAFDKGCEDGVYCRSCYGEDSGAYHFITGGGFPDVDFIAQPTTQKEPTMSQPTRTPRKTPAAEQFAALGLTDETAWTKAMQLAVKQRWAGLPVDVKVADLRARLAAVETAVVPTVEEMLAEHAAMGEPIDDVARARAEAERKRLVRNANVNAWRERNQIQAALDARDLKFSALRAARKTA